MIQLNCTNCKSLLTIDEAFAGGSVDVATAARSRPFRSTSKRKSKDGAGSSAARQPASGSKSKAKSLYKKALHRGGNSRHGSG